MMKFRKATTADAPGICQMVNYYAERGRMLHRSLESVYQSVRSFTVAEDDGDLVGCVAVDVFWSDLAEVKSLAVAPRKRGQGIGAKLLQRALAEGRRLGVKKLFALTYEQRFFLKQGFTRIDRDTLPEKVWRECIACPKADACDEAAFVYKLNKAATAPRASGRGRKRASR